jgi:CzcA family heavy metal efflux pump
MMRWIVGSSLKLRRVVVVAAAGMMAVGFAQLDKTSVDLLPEFMPPTVEVQTEALGLSATEVEELITVPYEQDLLNGIAFLKTIRSESVEGLSAIELIFEPGTDILSARQLVQERLSEGQGGALPNVSKPTTMLQPVSSTRRLMMIGMSSKKLSPIQMGVLARWTIRPRLQGVPGVANVSVWGQRERQLQVLVDPRRLHERGVTLQDVIETTGNALWVSPLTYLEASTPGTGGFIESPNQRLAIQHILPVSKAEDLAQIALAKREGERTSLRLGDVATVVEDHQPLIGDAVLPGAPGFLLVVEKLPEASTLEVTQALEDALEALKPGLADIHFDTSIYRAADYIRSSIDNLRLALIIGAVLLLLVLGAFFYDWRAALIGAVSISLSMAVALIVLRVLGTTVNTIVVAGLAMALVALIDDAVVGVESVTRRLRQRGERDTKSTVVKIVEATVEARGALLFAALAMALAVVPLFLVKGIAGAFFPTLARSYLLAIFASMAIALTVTPALGMLLLVNAAERPEPPLVRWLQRGSDRILSPIVGRPSRVLIALGVLTAIGLAMLPIIRRGPVLPTFKEPALIVEVDAAPGTSQPEMNRIITNASSELRSIPGIRNVGAHVGRAVTGDQIVAVNAAEIWVTFDAKADHDATIRSIREVMAGYPGLDTDVLVYSNDRVRDLLTGVETDLVVRVFGEDLGVLTSKAQEIQTMLGGIDGVVNPFAELPLQEPTVEIEPNLAAAQRHGIKPGDVRRQAAWLLGGLEVGKLFEQNKVFEVIVWSTPEVRSRLADIRGLLIDKPDGSQVRLSDVADVRIRPNPTIIKRESVSRAIDVMANVRGRSLGAVIHDMEAGFKTIDFPLEYHAEVLQDPVQRQADARRLLGFAIAAAIGVLLLLQAALGSWRPALLLFVTMPVALAGCLVGAAVGDRTASIGTVGALFAVLYITLRNGVLLLKRYRQLEREGGDDLRAGLILRGARERIGPTVMTASATVATLLPILVLGSRAGSEILRPMALVIIGGLVTSTIVTAFALPALHLRFRGTPGTRTVDDDVDQARRAFVLWEQEEPERVGAGFTAATETPKPA